MPYQDYCVSILDKVYGVFRDDSDMPTRTGDYDTMFYAHMDKNDPVTNLNQ